jgi:signal peptidase II
VHILQTQGGAAVTRYLSRPRAFLLFAGVVALDQLVKTAVVSALAVGESLSVIGEVLRITHIRNTGAAFGMLKGLGGVFALAAIVGIVAFASLVVRRPPLWTGVGAALVAAGAAGNLFDRLFRDGGVVDYVDFRFWPAFNVADSAITIGAVVLLLSSATERRVPQADGVQQSG